MELALIGHGIGVTGSHLRYWDDATVLEIKIVCVGICIR